MRIIYSLLLIVLILPPVSAGAEAVSLNDVITTLETPFKSPLQTEPGMTTAAIRDFQAEFSQESQIAAIDRVQRGQGKVSFMFLRRASDQDSLAMFRWEYRQPTVQEIISDGRTLWVYVPENRQVIESDISRISRQQGENPVTFLGGLGNLSRDFKISWAEPKVDEDGNYLIELQPRRDSQLIRTLRIVVARAAVMEYTQHKISGKIFPFLATMVTDPNGNRTSIEFHNIRVNPELSENFFTFVRPEGVDVIHPTEVLPGN